MTPALAAIIASIKARDAQKPRRPTDPVPWDVQLVLEIERLLDLIAGTKEQSISSINLEGKV